MKKYQMILIGSCFTWIASFLGVHFFDSGKAAFSASLTAILVCVALFLLISKESNISYVKPNWLRLAIIAFILLLPDVSRREVVRELWSVPPTLALALLAESVALRLRRLN